MSTPSPSQTPAGRFDRFLPRGRGWWIVVAAFVAGLLLFLLMLAGKRDEFEFYRADGGPRGVEGQVFEPLPAPLPADRDAATGLDPQPPARSEAPRIDPQAAPVAEPAPGIPPVATTGTAGAVAGDASVPRPLTAPPPEFPRTALRRGVSGEVLLRIDVDASGVPTSVEIERSSRNRELDRAAVQAVRRWRFQPAVRDGVPVPASVQQLISFEPPE